MHTKSIRTVYINDPSKPVKASKSVFVQLAKTDVMVGSHDFRIRLFSGIVSAHGNVDLRQQLL